MALGDNETVGQLTAIELLKRSFNEQGKLEVQISDQTSPVMIVPMNEVANETTLSVAGEIDDTTITVAVTTGFTDGAFIVIASVDDNRYYVGKQVGAIAGSVVTLDTPLDFAYEAGTLVTNGIDSLNVDGSSTTRIFSLRASDPGLPLVVDVTRVLFNCVTTDPPDLSMFGDIAGGLTKGIVLRRTDGTHNNIFNAKTNNDLAGLMFDWTPYLAASPGQGVNGFSGRLTFAGSNKIGVALRIGPDEDLQLLVQDNLSTLLTFKVIVEGHVVVD